MILGNFLKDSNGLESSKRLIGISGSYALIGSRIYYHTPDLIYSVLTLCLTCLGLAVTETLVTLFKK